jgi:hypothetical protein
MRTDRIRKQPRWKESVLRLFPVEAERLFLIRLIQYGRRKVISSCESRIVGCGEQLIGPSASVCRFSPTCMTGGGHCCTAMGRDAIVENIFAQRLPIHISAVMA